MNVRAIKSVGSSWSLLKSPCSHHQSGSSDSDNGRVGKAGFSLQSLVLEESFHGRQSKKSCRSHRTSLQYPTRTLNGHRRRLDQRWLGLLHSLPHCLPTSLHEGEPGQPPHLWKTEGSSAVNNRHNMQTFNVRLLIQSNRCMSCFVSDGAPVAWPIAPWPPCLRESSPPC